MIHTFQMYAEVINIYDFLSAFAFPKNSIDKLLASRKKVLKLRYVKLPPGILEIFVLSFGLSFYVFIKIEPQRLLDNKATLKLFKPTAFNILKLFTYFDRAMLPYLINCPELQYLSYLSSYKLCRIDYTKDFSTSYVPEILNLLKNSGKKNNRYHFSDGNGYSSYYAFRQSYSITLYNKSDEISNKFNRHNNYTELINASQDILRFEFQFKKSAIAYRCKKLEINNNVISFLIASQKLAPEILSSEYRKIVGTGSFYKAYRANKIINDSSFSPAMKKRLTVFLKDLSGSSMKKYSSPTIRSYTAKLEELGISPIIIPKNWKCPSCIPNPAKNLENM